jgi:hypothetical protein
MSKQRIEVDRLKQELGQLPHHTTGMLFDWLHLPDPALHPAIQLQPDHVTSTSTSLRKNTGCLSISPVFHWISR